MGTYKVPQNVEAEDKILGPLSLKQFIYALIGIGYGLLTFAIFSKISIVIWVFLGAPPMLALLALGLYQRQDQPMEVFIIAILEFFVRPRSRTWQKEPIAEVFRLEPPPPKIEEAVRDQRQVHSQLAQLSHLVDTRGWSIKESVVQEPNEQPLVDLRDRLGVEGLSSPSLFFDAPEVTDDDDILNAQSAAAQNLNVLMENTSQSVRDEAMERMRMHSVAAKPSISGSTAVPSDAILKLATEGGDLTIAQIAAQARRQTSNALSEGESVSIPHGEATAA